MANPILTVIDKNIRALKNIDRQNQLTEEQQLREQQALDRQLYSVSINNTIRNHFNSLDTDNLDLNTFEKESNRYQETIKTIPSWAVPSALNQFGIQYNNARNAIVKSQTAKKDRELTLQTTDSILNMQTDLTKLAYNGSSDATKELHQNYTTSIEKAVKLNMFTPTQGRNLLLQANKDVSINTIVGTFDREQTLDGKRTIIKSLEDNRDKIESLTPKDVDNLLSTLNRRFKEEKVQKDVLSFKEADKFNSVIKRLSKGAYVSAQDLEDAKNIASLNDKTEQMDIALDKYNYITNFNSLPLAQQRNILNKPTNYPYADIKDTLKTAYDNKILKLDSDPVSLIKNIEPMDLESFNDKAKILDRLNTVEGFSYLNYDNYDSINKYLTTKEANNLINNFNSGDVKSVEEVISGLKEWGDKKYEIIAQLARSNLVTGYEIDFVSNMEPDILQKYINSRAIKPLNTTVYNENKKDIDDYGLMGIYGEEGGIAMGKILSSLSKTEPLSSVKSLLMQVNGNRNITKYNGVKVENPTSDLDADDFIDSLTVEDIETLGGIEGVSNKARKTIDYSVFGWVTWDLSGLRDTSDAIELIRGLTPISLGDGKYHFMDDNGNILIDGNGNYFTLDYQKIRSE